VADVEVFPFAVSLFKKAAVLPKKSMTISKLEYCHWANELELL
jgi:hypothetical protein